MAKRGPPFKTGVKVSVEDVRQAIDDLYFERGDWLLRGCWKLRGSFFASWPGGRTAKRAKLKQIRDARETGVIWLDVCPRQPKRSSLAVRNASGLSELWRGCLRHF
jgi:hypothetical protein